MGASGRGSDWGRYHYYVMPGIHTEALATIAAGLLGALIVFVVAYFGARSGGRKTETVE